MRVIASSDWHIPPDLEKMPAFRRTEIEKHVDYLEEQLKTGCQVVLVGDIFNFLDYSGWRKYENNPIMQRVRKWKKDWGDKLVILGGNHDRKYPRYLPTKRSKTIADILFLHGHQFDFFWGWFIVDRLPSFLDPILDPIRKRLYTTPAKKRERRDLRDYHLSTLWVEYGVEKRGIKKKYRAVIFGHTHQPIKLEREDIIKIANCGDWVDSFKYVELDTETLDIQILPKVRRHSK